MVERICEITRAQRMNERRKSSSADTFDRPKKRRSRYQYAYLAWNVKIYENEKDSKYGDEVRAWGGNMEFSPSVIESYGAFGDCAQAVCKLAGIAAEELHSGWRCGEAVASCIVAAAVALHRGNARAVHSCYRMASKSVSGAGPGRPRGAKDRIPRQAGSGLRYKLR